MVDILTALIVILDLVLSVWNCYNAGLSYGMLKKNGGPSWAYLSPALGLSMGLAGAVYVTAMVVGVVAYILGLVDSGMVDLLFAYNALITGALITALGIGVTIESIYIAVRRPGGWSIATALYNTFASTWNVFAYLRDFGPVTSIINYERRDDRQSSIVTLIVVALVAVVLGVLLSYFAFWMGRNHGEGPRQRPFARAM